MFKNERHANRKRDRKMGYNVTQSHLLYPLLQDARAYMLPRHTNG